MATWALYIKVGFRAFILPKKIVYNFKTLKEQIVLLKIFGFPKFYQNSILIK
jgi:hypothetical protein